MLLTYLVVRRQIFVDQGDFQCSFRETNFSKVLITHFSCSQNTWFLLVLEQFKANALWSFPFSPKEASCFCVCLILNPNSFLFSILDGLTQESSQTLVEDKSERQHWFLFLNSQAVHRFTGKYSWNLPSIIPEYSKPFSPAKGKLCHTFYGFEMFGGGEKNVPSND